MTIVKCKMCGGDIVLNEEKTFGTCEYCGSTMTLPKVSDDQRAALFNRGNHFRRAGEFDKALAIYENIVREDDTDAEAHWCCALCRFGIEYVEDPNTYEFIPTCHRASFDSFLEDVDYLAALENSDGITRRQYQKDGAKIAEVQKGILATSQNEEPFDVFICYKETDDNTKERTKDSIDAQEIYYQLTNEGYRVFFSRITLEDKAGAEYEPYIFAALNSAKVMVAIGSKPEYFNAVWVKNEWSRFLALMRKDRSKLLIPCYKNMDPYDLPEQLSVLQSYDMTKIGFMQDLIRGIKKVVRKDEPAKAQVAQTAVQQPAQTAGGTNLIAQLKRGAQALEDRDWAQAKVFFDKALDIDAESAEAFFGKALADAQCASGEELVKTRLAIPVDNEKTLIACERDEGFIQKTIAESAVPGFLPEKDIRACFKFDERTYSSLTTAWKNRLNGEKYYWENNKLLNRALRFAKGDLAKTIPGLRARIEGSLKESLEKSIKADETAKAEITSRYVDELKKAEEQALSLHEDAKKRQLAYYENACNVQASAQTQLDYRRAIGLFEHEGLAGFKDSADRAKQCAAEIDRIDEEEKEERERKLREAERAEKAKKKKETTIILIIGLLAALGIAIALLYSNVIVPANKYKAAEDLLAQGKYEEAITAFEELNGYKDSVERISECETAINEGKYTDASKLFISGKYNEALAVFSQLQDFKDSEEMIEKCKIAINDEKYSQALELYSAGKYKEAISAFSQLQGYMDCDSKIEEIKPLYYNDMLGNAKRGSAVLFGNYDQDGDQTNGKEEIEWIVLAKEDNNILLISRYSLDCQPYYPTSGYPSVTWENSAIRGWLNGTFFETAFGKCEQEFITATTVKAQNNPFNSSTSPGRDCTDKVFLLSAREAITYFGSKDNRKCTPTEYASEQGVRSIDSTCNWWLRSPGSNSSCAAYVKYDGEISSRHVGDSDIAVRPVIWVCISPLD